MTILVVLAYLGAAVGANLAVAALGAHVAPLVAFVLIGLDLSSRDWLHERWGRGLGLWARMFGRRP
jgi:hypothetical protein